MQRVITPDGLDVWARLAQKYIDDRSKLTEHWRSVTELVNPPKISALARLHKDEEIEINVIYLLRAIEGTALHSALASVATETELVGHRIYTEFGGHRISGEPDLVVLKGDGHCDIVDFKRVRAAHWIYHAEDDENEYAWQLRLYAWLVERELGYTVDSLRLEMRFADWSEADSKRDHRYPPSPLMIKPVERRTTEDVEGYLLERIRLHEQAEADPQSVLCTEQERWARGGYWCLVGKSGRALPNAKYDSYEQAALARSTRGGEVEYRPAMSKRCAPRGDYGGCPVRKWCKQYSEQIAVAELGIKLEVPMVGDLKQKGE